MRTASFWCPDCTNETGVTFTNIKTTLLLQSEETHTSSRSSSVSRQLYTSECTMRFQNNNNNESHKPFRHWESQTISMAKFHFVVHLSLNCFPVALPPSTTVSPEICLSEIHECTNTPWASYSIDYQHARSSFPVHPFKFAFHTVNFLFR